MKALPIPEDILTNKLKDIFGSVAAFRNWSLLTGGARKKVIHLQLSGTLPDLVLLIWQNENNYFGERDNAESDRSDRMAPLLYQANTKLLLSAGVRVPQIYYFDASYDPFPFAYALVEYVQAIPFNAWMPNHTRAEVEPLFGRISSCLDRLRLIKRNTYGTPLDESVKPMACHELVHQEAIQGLAGLSDAFDNVRLAKTQVERKLQVLFQAIEPRQQYSLIHDELGPDEHLLIDQNGEIVLIDVDGCQFFDLEREHAYLKLRFGKYYAYLQRDDLDETRMRFYTFCLHISAAYGHYLLFKKGFPDPDMLREIFEYNIQKILKICAKDKVYNIHL